MPFAPRRASMPELELWDDLRLVAAIGEAYSLNGAAKILDLNHSTVFRRLVALEDALGVRLFERGRAGYSSTAAGVEMAALADRMAQHRIRALGCWTRR
jgi:DNA-binding transcriptional LysR family regulator